MHTAIFHPAPGLAPAPPTPALTDAMGPDAQKSRAAHGGIRPGATKLQRKWDAPALHDFKGNSPTRTDAQASRRQHHDGFLHIAACFKQPVSSALLVEAHRHQSEEALARR